MSKVREKKCDALPARSAKFTDFSYDIRAFLTLILKGKNLFEKCESNK